MNYDVSSMRWSVTMFGIVAGLAAGLVGSALFNRNPNTSISMSDYPQGITVSGHSEMKADPDIALVSLGVVTRKPTAKEASQINAQTANRIMDAVTKLEVDKKDIQTRHYTTQPWVSYDRNGNEKRLGYEVRNTVVITVRDLSKVSDVIDDATLAGANSVQGVAFTIDNEEAARNKVISAAVEDARTKAESVAKTLDVRVGKPISVSESSEYPQQQYANLMPAIRSTVVAKSETPISPGQMELSQDVVVTFAIRP